MNIEKHKSHLNELISQKEEFLAEAESTSKKIEESQNELFQEVIGHKPIDDLYTAWFMLYFGEDHEKMLSLGEQIKGYLAKNENLVLVSLYHELESDNTKSTPKSTSDEYIETLVGELAPEGLEVSRHPRLGAKEDHYRKKAQKQSLLLRIATNPNSKTYNERRSKKTGRACVLCYGNRGGSPPIFSQFFPNLEFKDGYYQADLEEGISGFQIGTTPSKLKGLRFAAGEDALNQLAEITGNDKVKEAKNVLNIYKILKPH